MPVTRAQVLRADISYLRDILGCYERKLEIREQELAEAEKEEQEGYSPRPLS
jgi:hypothetical protein